MSAVRWLVNKASKYWKGVAAIGTVLTLLVATLLPMPAKKCEPDTAIPGGTSENRTTPLHASADAADRSRAGRR